MASINRPNHPCTNPACGNTLYTADRDWMNDGEGLKYVWRCTCCGQLSERKTRSRRSNAMRAWDAVRAIQAEWQETEDALKALVDSGTPSGCLLVHSRTFNYHLDCLRGLHTKDGQKKLSYWEVRYHSAKAREDLAQAKQFVQEKQAVEKEIKWRKQQADF